MNSRETDQAVQFFFPLPLLATAAAAEVAAAASVTVTVTVTVSSQSDAVAVAAAVFLPPVLTVDSFAFVVVALPLADAVLDAAAFADVEPLAAAAPCCTTTQLPKPPAVVKDTRHLLPVLPPVHVVPFGSCTWSCSEPVPDGAWLDRNNQLLFVGHDSEII